MDQSNQEAIDAQGQLTEASELAERHRRTSKHRAPLQSGRVPQRKPRQEQSARPQQQQLPLRKSGSLVDRLSPDIFTNRIIRTFWAIGVGMIVIGIVIFLYFIFAGSRFFALRTIEVQGNVLLTREEVESIVGRVAEKGVVRADLNKIREELEVKDITKDVIVTRLLPDMIKVVIKEREPYALARRADGSVGCVDREGNIFGDPSLFRSRPVMPLINGLAERGERSEEINRQRLMTYQKLLSELDGSQPPLSSRIDEVYFDDVQGVRVILADSRIAVFLGKEDFRMRLNAALDVLDAIRRRDAEALNVLRIGDAEKLISGAKISYLNATIPKRVVVGLEE